jgi:hypothetical protein
VRIGNLLCVSGKSLNRQTAKDCNNECDFHD